MSENLRLAAVIPCYRERGHILDVLQGIGPEVSQIFVVDDACPDKTGDYVEENSEDPRVTIVRLATNEGVGGATISGYQAAVDAGAEIIVKLDGDGQMDASLIEFLIQPIVEARADYTKGNRFHRRDSAKGMPAVRLIGNIGLTLFSKMSSGYWNIMDPTNGFTAIHASVVSELPLSDIAKDYFFESDLLSKLSGLEAVVVDVPMQARYGEETSALSIHRIFFQFLAGHIRNGWRRIIDTYFVRDMGVASLELVGGLVLLLFGCLYGGFHWWRSIESGITASAGTVILAALPIILGVQFLIAFLGHDTRRVPTQPIYPRLAKGNESSAAS